LAEKETAQLLVVCRDSAVLRPLWSIAESHAWSVEITASAWDAIEHVQSGAAPNLLLLDLPQGDDDFLHILRWMRRLRPDLPVIVTCSSEDASRKRDAMRLGAQEVLVKPIESAGLESALQRQLGTVDDMDAEIASEHIEQIGPDSFFVSASTASQKLRAQAELLAEADVPVLILGEMGSGKHTVARLIHKLSVRSGFQFFTVNCADMPDDLLEAELFGSERMISRSHRNALGKIKRAERGTILLNEISELPLPLQARLMDVLQDRVILSSEGEITTSTDVRILACSSANMSRALEEGKLREDLYYRLSAFSVQVPPLRRRRSEIGFLLQHSMHQLCKHYGLPRREFSSEMLSACQRYSWPGNLTELERFIKRYLVAGQADLNFDCQLNLQSAVSAKHVLGVTKQISDISAAKGTKIPQSSATSLKAFIENVKGEAERNAIGAALQKTGWNRKAASRLLQVSYRTLLYKIDQYQMSATDACLPSLAAGNYSLDRTVTRRDKKI
jgi:two-component system, NtrC family, response regulator AtoC